MSKRYELVERGPALMVFDNQQRMTADRVVERLNDYERRLAETEAASLAAADEIERLRGQVNPAAKWEADHQRAALIRYGLAEEFPYGCDAIDAVSEALINARAEIERLRAVVETLPTDAHGRSITAGCRVRSLVDGRIHEVDAVVGGGMNALYTEGGIPDGAFLVMGDQYVVVEEEDGPAAPWAVALRDGEALAAGPPVEVARGIRAGDLVRHRPTGETWVVGAVSPSGLQLAWCGYPDGCAEVADCELVEACSDERHVEVTRECAASGGLRSEWARALLEKTPPATTAEPPASPRSGEEGGGG